MWLCLQCCSKQNKRIQVMGLTLKQKTCLFYEIVLEEQKRNQMSFLDTASCVIPIILHHVYFFIHFYKLELNKLFLSLTSLSLYHLQDELPCYMLSSTKSGELSSYHCKHDKKS